MEAARNKPYVTTIAPDDDGGVVGDVCTAKQDAFARVWAETGNQAAAYRKAYNVDERTLPGTMWSAASRLAAIPCVRKKADEYRQQAALETIVSARDALQWQLDIATANPNDIGYVAKRACRSCYGHNHKYQWADRDEYITACAVAMDEEKDPPSDEGGYGYTRAREPALDCPQCLGGGNPETIVNDTRKLEGKALKLFKGIDYKNGEWVVTMHDQAKAWENVIRMLGAFNDKLDLRTPSQRQGAAKLPDGLSEQETARAYLAMLG